jgi:glucose uptake protein GlcU
LKPENVEIPAFNYVGVAIACLSGIVFLAIRVGKSKEKLPELQSVSHLTSLSVVNRSCDIAPEGNNEILPTVNRKMRVIGCSLAIFAGILFGLVFTPSTYIQDHLNKYPGATKNGLHYVFSMYTGILLTSSIYYGVYIILKRNRPYVCVESILPAFISGIMWGIAQAAFIFANSALSQSISFPLVTTGPATIAALWSIFYFREIRGLRNYLIFVGGTLLRIIAAIFIILSKPISN